MTPSLLISIFALALGPQARPGISPFAPGRAPIFPPFTSQQFQDAVVKVEECLAAHDFKGAEHAASLLPKADFSIDMDFKKAPEDLRQAFMTSYGRAVRDWHMPEMYRSATPDVKITLTPQLAIDPLTNAPANLAVFFSDKPGTPRLTVVIGLRRDKPERSTTPRDIYNDVRFAIGTYLGLTTHDVATYLMIPTAQVDEERTLAPPEYRAAVQAIGLSRQLRFAVRDHRSVGISGHPEAEITPKGFNGDALQGDRVPLPVQVTNRGNGVLTVNAIGDCGCIVPESGPAVEAGKTGTLSLRLETIEYANPIERHIYVFTNDPKHPIHTIDVHLDISPRYRLVFPQGNTWVFDTGSQEGDAYLWFPDGADLLVIDARIVGIEGSKATYEPWKGEMADPERKEGKKPRHGYHVHITIPDKLPPGRSPVNLRMLTSSAEFQSISETIFVQRGIVSLPDQLFMGEVGSLPIERTLILSRPGRPFQVKSVSVDNKHFKVRAVPGDKEGEQKLVVNYLGDAPPGGIGGYINVVTDDPKQPVLKILLAGSAT